MVKSDQIQTEERMMETELNRTEKSKKTNGKKHIVLWVVLAVLAVGAVSGGLYLNKILNHPEDMFDADQSTPLPEPSVLSPAFPIPDAVSVDGRDSSVPNPPVTSSPDMPVDPSDGQVDGILNIMLMGIDAYENGKTSSGTMPHTDTMMVIAIDFDRNKVDLITLPRDTFTTAPGHYGFYKLNGVFNVGLNGKFKTSGKADDLASGFELTCRAGEQWLGGISIPYYYAVDFQAVVDIVDAIGGIDYDVDQPFSAHSGKRYYKEGLQHLDGDAVLGYLRIRQNADGLDSSRTARQRRMMVAIFQKLKSEGTLSQIPALISAANSGIYTNTTIAQTTSLVKFAADLDSEDIKTHSMYGEIGAVEFMWRFAYVDQQNRIDLIREVYGIDAQPVGICTRQYERWLYSIGFVTMKRLRQIEKVLARVQEMKDGGAAFSEEQIARYTDCYTSYLALYNAFNQYSDELADYYGVNNWRDRKTDKASWTREQQEENARVSEREAAIRQELIDLSEEALAAVKALGNAIGYRSISWSINGTWYQDTDVNEVIVAFG